MTYNQITKLEYLNNTDITLKGNLKSHYLIPKIERIRLEYSINEIAKQVLKKNSDKPNFESKLAFFLLNFLVFSEKPFATNVVPKEKTSKGGLMEENFYLSTRISLKKNVILFFQLLSLNNKNTIYRIAAQKFKNYKLKSYISFEDLIGINETFNLLNLFTNLKELTFKMTVYTKKVKNKGKKNSYHLGINSWPVIFLK